MRGLRSTLVLFGTLVVVGGYAYFVERERPPASEANANERVFDFEADDVTELRVTAESGEITHLERVDADAAWAITAPIKARADDTNPSSIASSLASLELSRVVDEQPADLSPFGLAEPAMSIGVKLTADEDVRHLLIGDKNPTGASRYARTDDCDRVFLIAGYLGTTFNRTTFDLRDRSILDFERDDVDGLVTTMGGQTIRLAKTENEWRMREPWDVRADFSTVAGLVGRLNTGEMRTIEREAPEVLDPFGLDAARITVAIEAGSARATLSVGDKAPNGTVYARDTSRSLAFTIDQSLVDDLERGAGEYRRKDLFSFRPFNATRLQIDHAHVTVIFEKMEATSADEEDTWQRVEPAADKVERNAMEDLLAKFSNLRAESFVASRTNTGLDTPSATIHVRFGTDGKEERVTIGRTGEDTFAVHGDEPGAARIDTRAFDDALEALGTVQSESS